MLQVRQHFHPRTVVPGLMPLNSNFYSEWTPARRESSHRALLLALVACALGAIGSAAVILSLVDFGTKPAEVPPISVRAIVRTASAPDDTKTAKNSPMGETPIRQPEIGIVSTRDETVTQTEAEHPSEEHDQQLRTHSRLREPHWRPRFTRTFSRSPRFGFW